MTTRALTTVVALAGAGVLLTGCSGAGRPDTAAVVNGHTFSITDVTEATRQINDAMRRAAQGSGQQAQPVPEARIVNLLVLSELVLPEARAAGWQPDNQLNSALAMIPNPTPSTVAVYQTNQALAQLDALGDGARQRIVAAASTADVQVNPRYGDFDRATGAVLQAEREWLVKPTSNATPTVVR